MAFLGWQFEFERGWLGDRCGSGGGDALEALANEVKVRSVPQASQQR